MDYSINAEIITTGSELMTGEILDTNAAWLSEVLNSLGITVQRHTSIGDNIDFLKESFLNAWQHHHVTIVTGGLGPTEDDLTRAVAAATFNKPLELQEYLVEEMKVFFKRHSFNLPENNLRQCYLPKDMHSIKNPNGTAPGFYYEKDNKIIIFLPGVPNETKPMALNWLKPYLLKKYAEKLGYISNFIIKTAGIGESALDEKIADLMQKYQANPSISLLANNSETRIVIRCQAKNKKETEEIIEPIVQKIEERLEKFIYGYEDDTLATEINKLLIKNKLKVCLTDAISQGRLISLILPYLNKDNCGQIVILNDSENKNIFNKLEETSNDNIIHLSFIGEEKNNCIKPEKNEIYYEFNTLIKTNKYENGSVYSTKSEIGGEVNKTLYRAANLCLFNFWIFLKKIE